METPNHIRLYLLARKISVIGSLLEGQQISVSNKVEDEDLGSGVSELLKGLAFEIHQTAESIENMLDTKCSGYQKRVCFPRSHRSTKG